MTLLTSGSISSFMTKSELRNKYLSKRLALSEKDYQLLSLELSNRFFLHTNLTFVKVIHIFIPIIEKREPDTWNIINRLQKDFPATRIVVPRVRGEEMEQILFTDLKQLKKNKWKIPEPEFGTLIQPDEIDMVIVPLLAYDVHGHRVGYGRGFYDRFLKTCRKDCIKIGLSFFEPEKHIHERLEEDVLLDQCITPFGSSIF